MRSRYADLGRPPLNLKALRRALVVPGGLWRELRVVERTGSTNSDVAAAARAGAAEGLVIVAEQQVAGRGRLDRRWESPPRAGLTLSVLLRPGSTTGRGRRLGWLPLLAGVAVADAVGTVTELPARLKWPNDVLVDERKCAGVLAEATPDGAIVVGIGLNVSLTEAELPRPDATSLLLAGAAYADRDPLLRALLRNIAHRYEQWRGTGAGALRCAYEERCVTLGRAVRVALPGGRLLEGVASRIDAGGRLIVGGVAVAAGDVVHVHQA